MWNTNGSQSSASLRSTTPDCSGQLSCWWSRADPQCLHLRFLIDTCIRSCILNTQYRFSLHWLMRLHKVLSCAIRSGSFLHKHDMHEDTEYSHRYQTWPDADSSVESSSTNSLSTTITVAAISFHPPPCISASTNTRGLKICVHIVRR